MSNLTFQILYLPSSPFATTLIYPESMFVLVEYASQSTMLTSHRRREMGVDAQNLKKGSDTADSSLFSRHH